MKTIDTILIILTVVTAVSFGTMFIMIVRNIMRGKTSATRRQANVGN